MNFSKEDLEVVLYCQETMLDCDRGKALALSPCLAISSGRSSVKVTKITWVFSLLPSQGARSPYTLANKLKLLTVEHCGYLRYGVFCGQLTIKEGMRFGPYTGSIVCPDEISSSRQQGESLWEVRN